MSEYEQLINLFELEKKYPDPEDRGRVRNYLEQQFNYLFNNIHKGNTNFENNRLLPGELTKGMETVLTFLNQFRKKYKELRLDEDLWVMDHLDWLFCSYSEGALEPSKKLNLNYSNKTVIFNAGRNDDLSPVAVPSGINFKTTDSPILLNIIEDYAFVLEEMISEQKKKTSSTKYNPGTLPKQLLARRLRQYWFNYANKPGKGKVGTSESKFNTYIELGFKFAGEEYPKSKSTINNYFEKG